MSDAGAGEGRRDVVAIVPTGIDDPARPSGGNRYDRWVIDALGASGSSVHEFAVAGSWLRPDGLARAALGRALRAATPTAPVLIDGMIASGAADLVTAAARSRPVVVLVHMPFGPVLPELAAAERRMLRSVHAVVATSHWTRKWLVCVCGVAVTRVHVASPGVDRAQLASRTAAGGRLLCVAAVTMAKGYDVLLAALAELATMPDLAGNRWRCTCIGRSDIDPDFAGGVRRKAQELGPARVSFTGPLEPSALDGRYSDADLLVLPSRAETWGMVVSEALARAIPVIAADVGGIPEALGRAANGRRPGLLTPPGDAGALADALRRWLAEPALREVLRAAAMQRRASLTGWDLTAAGLASALGAAAAACRPRADEPRLDVADRCAAGTRWSTSLSR